MKRILSFTVNHDVLTPGIYVSRIDGDITTYDLRTRVPNGGNYLTTGAMHTLEHLFATFIRSSSLAADVIYFGPMGCRTGFYLLIRNAENEAVLREVKAALRFISAFEGRIPGSDRIECGNYLDHDLAGAKREAADYLSVLEASTPDFIYKK